MVVEVTPVTEKEIAELAVEYKTKPESIKLHITSEMRLTSIWNELGHMRHECLICGQIVDGRKEGRHHIGNTNFGRTSHGKKHVNDGRAIDKWGGADGIMIAPTREQVVKYLDSKVRDQLVRRDLPKLRAERKSLADERRSKREQMEKIETALLKALRKDGRKALVDESFANRVADLEELQIDVEYLTSEIGVIESKYDERVVGALTYEDR
jgi:hypothetical protein